MAGQRCPIVHRLNPKARVDVKNDQLKAIKAALGLSRCPVHVVTFKVGFYFESLTTTKPITREVPIYLAHRYPAERFNC